MGQQRPGGRRRLGGTPAAAGARRLRVCAGRRPGTRGGRGSQGRAPPGVPRRSCCPRQERRRRRRRRQGGAGPDGQGVCRAPGAACTHAWAAAPGPRRGKQWAASYCVDAASGDEVNARTGIDTDAWHALAASAELRAVYDGEHLHSFWQRLFADESGAAAAKPLRQQVFLRLMGDSGTVEHAVGACMGLAISASSRAALGRAGRTTTTSRRTRTCSPTTSAVGRPGPTRSRRRARRAARCAAACAANACRTPMSATSGWRACSWEVRAGREEATSAHGRAAGGCRLRRARRMALP